ncbi:hypothetical protein [Lentzea albida]|uniref:Tryptophan 2,3-dioxygenase (Vermilion) n=1 Tax=Lentzea albida TaxID=65499 RepID=A0A1H9WRS9_9PSEU|nr:hypothetical protein [Lentzea albida]SES36489.1 Tryptophan 2,3-dioxygenase (vermilion) [Lentzea albida]
MTATSAVSKHAAASTAGARQGGSTPGLANSIRSQILRHGKDRLAEQVLDQVRASRSGTAIEPTTAAFYDCVLDKAENRYSYRSYLALDVLSPLLPPSGDVRSGWELVSHLLLDLAEFEQMTLDDHDSEFLPNGRPDRHVALRRIRKIDLLRGGAGSAGRSTSPAGELVEKILRFSVLPVSSQHDEYLFIRVLQCYETVFTTMATMLGQALLAAGSDRVREVARHVDSAATTLDQASGLFSLLATMPPAHFRSFRMQTDGSSAIQSEAYKLVEIFCALPKRARLDSPAFLSVPDVRLHALSGHKTLSSWHGRQQDRWSVAEGEMVTNAVQRLERSHQKWKRTHHSIAKSMIGTSGGTGGTEGIEYLRRCMENRLFWPISEQASSHHNS